MPDGSLMQDRVLVWTLVSLTFVLAGFVKGVLGMGLPTVAMGLLGALMAPVQAASLLIVPSIVTNFWQMATGPSLWALCRRFLRMFVTIVIGTFLGIGLITGNSAALASGALGSVLALYGCVGIAAPRFVVRPALEPWLSPAIGLVTGVITGATGVFVIPAVPYFNSLGLDKEELVQTLGLSFTVSTFALAGALASKGQFQAASVGISLLAVLPALAGMYFGQLVRGRLQPAVFRRWFFCGLIVLGVYMLAQALR